MASSFFITGGSQGIGLEIGRAVLNNGGSAVLTARDISKASKNAPDIEEKGGKWVQMDVTSPNCEQVLKDALSQYKIDTLVNNAGMAVMGAIEDISCDEMRTQMDINFYGPLRLIQAAVPTFRERGGGTIINVSSGAAFLGLQSRGIYSASKAALERASEALAEELQPFNIRVLLIDPGAFRTSFASSIITPAAYASSGGVSTPYKGSKVDEMITATRVLTTAGNGDASKAGLRIYEAATNTGMFAKGLQAEHLRVLLGSDTMKRAREVSARFKANIDAQVEVARSTDIDQTTS